MTKFEEVLATVSAVYLRGSKDHSDQKNTSSMAYLFEMATFIMETIERE
jgi:hypothetical protein